MENQLVDSLCINIIPNNSRLPVNNYFEEGARIVLAGAIISIFETIIKTDDFESFGLDIWGFDNSECLKAANFLNRISQRERKSVLRVIQHNLMKNRGLIKC